MKRIFLTTIFSILAFLLVAPHAQAATILKERMVLSPYFEANPAGAIYTLIAVSHPSLDTATSQIGFTMTAAGATDPNNSSDPSVTVTLNAGQTHRIFITATNGTITQALIDPTGTDSNLSLILTTSGGSTSQFGSVRVESTNTTPAVADGNGLFNNLSQLNFWGAVVILSTASGFAMEWIGDAHDSTIISGTTTLNDLTARGIN